MMIERKFDGNIFLLPQEQSHAAVVTTNGMRRRDGSLVMGAGIARYCRDSMPRIDEYLGNSVAAMGNHAYFCGAWPDAHRPESDRDVNVVSMPTKHDWRDRSDVDLIRRSCREMVAIADQKGLTAVYMPAPGCANGGLDYASDVRPVLMDELDERFVVCLPTRMYDSVHGG